jgi:sugar transferase (PEP-CTERM/EpsH1 system associated)
MKVLFLCHRFPYPPDFGSRVRAFQIVRHLHASGHKVTVASLTRSAPEVAAAEGLAPYCDRLVVGHVSEPAQFARMLARLPTTTPSSMGYFYSRRLAEQIQRLTTEEPWDLIVAHCSSIAPYVAHMKRAPMLLDFADMDSQKWFDYARFKPWPLSWGYWLEGRKMAAAERRMARCFDICTVTTPAERVTLDAIAPGAQTAWFPNGVDAEFFAPTDGSYDADQISFIGRMDYYPNQECMMRFCKDVWPALKLRRPALRLAIVGAEPPAEVLRLGQLPGVEVTGRVDDVRPYVRRSAAMVAPLAIARGTQNKILEAMAMGVPVITSRIAAAGVDTQAGMHCVVADTALEIERAVLELVENSAHRMRLAPAGRKAVLRCHSWPGAMQRFDALIERCAATFHSAAARDGGVVA